MAVNRGLNVLFFPRRYVQYLLIVGCRYRKPWLYFITLLLYPCSFPLTDPQPGKCAVKYIIHIIKYTTVCSRDPAHSAAFSSWHDDTRHKSSYLSAGFGSFNRLPYNMLAGVVLTHIMFCLPALNGNGFRNSRNSAFLTRSLPWLRIHSAPWSSRISASTAHYWQMKRK